MKTAIPRLLRIVTITCIFPLFLSTTQGAVRRVPADYPRIQTAIDNSSNGDVILVNPGIYSENVNFKGKAVTLSSTNPADPKVVSATIIRAVGKNSAVSFVVGETSKSVLTGFTITGGYGTLNTTFGTNVYVGAGIYCNRSSPTIIGNQILSNAAPADASAISYGAGIGLIESSALVSRNLVTANTGYLGGGVMTYLGNARIVSNVIYSNSALAGGGAGLFYGGQLINNTVVGNAADIGGNVAAVSDVTAVAEVAGNNICNASRGGGLYLENDDTNTGVAFNDLWNNADGDYPNGPSRTGLDGNISADPLFVGALTNNFQLQDTSPCINAGDPAFEAATNEFDFYGAPRVYAWRVDIGASEYSDNFRPLAVAGPDHAVGVIALPAVITLDGSASYDPNSLPLSYHWTQLSGPPGNFLNATAAKPAFTASALGKYTFELIVDNGSFSSFSDTVEVTLKNDPPTANAGNDQLFSDLEPIASITLDGSGSTDPENPALAYRWRQLSGWRVQLSDPNSAKPVFLHPWPGVYVFELVVNDGMLDSAPDTVAIVIGPNHAPIANAGPARYVATNSVTLDGTGSYDPDGYGTLTYAWRQISGPAITITGTNTSTPQLSGFRTNNTIQRCVFELIVNDGKLASAPSTVTVTIVRAFGTNALRLLNPPFNPARPTILAFGGGNCNTGVGMNFGGVWLNQANWLTVDSYGQVYTKYADMLIVYLSSVAPDYRQPIQTMGFSTGNLPAMDVAPYINTTYNDARYAVNRVALLDAVCNNLGAKVTQFNASRVAGEQCWVDNYISNDPGFNRQPALNGAINIVCNPPRAHSYPPERYLASPLEYTNGGLTAFAYLSLIGSGRNYQLNSATNKYYFTINAAGSIVFFNQGTHPGKILAPVRLLGPTNGSTIEAGGGVLGCEPVENAVRYQVLLGSTPDRVMNFQVVSESTNPPTHLVTALPGDNTWWTVKAFDQFGSSIYADARLLTLPENNAPTANAGSDQVSYAGLDGKATVTFSGSNSSDPDGDPLGYTWAWVIDGRAYQSNGPSLTVQLPVGEHLVQLMVNDGALNSQPVEVTVTVVAPMECRLRIAPTTIQVRSQGRHVLARIRLPADAEVNPDEPLRLYPGGNEATRTWTEGPAGNRSLFAFFDPVTLRGAAPNDSAQLTVAGKLTTGQWFYGRAEVTLIAPGQQQRER